MTRSSQQARQAKHARRVVETALDVTVETCEPLHGGAISETFVATLDGSLQTSVAGPVDSDSRRVVCKFGGANIWTGDVIEPLVTRLVDGETDLPVPAVLASGSLRRSTDNRVGSKPDRWALYEFLHGTPARQDATGDCWTVEDHRAFVGEAGELLGRLHATFGFDRIGGFVRKDGALRLCEPTSRNLLASTPRNLLTAPSGDLLTFLTASPETLLTSSTGTRDVSTAPRPADDAEMKPVLDHGDYRPGNLLVREGKIEAVLDWANAHVTDPGYALARAETQFVDFASVPRSDRRRLRRAFRAGYATWTSLPPSYPDRAPMYRALWVLQSAVNLGTVATTARGRTQLQRQLRNWLLRRDIL